MLETSSWSHRHGQQFINCTVIGVINIAVTELNLAVQPGADNYQAPWSPILRYGITASVWLAVVILFLPFLCK
ncbi:meckelin-like isoform X1 [Huso huso]|uniref:Meckelin-like isoform X1 n=1 Tax=Huso huso TaxID=61971 RepID=A0ABR0Z5A8_HUSHU